MNKKPYISPSVSAIKIEIGNILQGSQRTLNVSNETATKGVWADARESFGFEEITEEEE